MATPSPSIFDQPGYRHQFPYPHDGHPSHNQLTHQDATRQETRHTSAYTGYSPSILHCNHDNIKFHSDSLYHSCSHDSSSYSTSLRHASPSHTQYDTSSSEEDETTSETHPQSPSPSPGTTDLDFSYRSSPSPTPPFQDPPPERRPKKNSIPISLLQWNQRGTQTSLSELKDTLQKEQTTIALLQESHVHYNKDYTPHQISHYHLYHDEYHKTSIYISDRIRHIAIPLPSIYQPHVPALDRLHATAIIAYLKIGTKTIPVACLNLYRSPTGRADPCDYLQYVQHIRRIYQKKKLKHTLHNWIIGGDLNASHPSWGGPVGTHKKHILGRRLYDHLIDHGYHIQNNGQPTRFWVDKSSQPHESYIDITFTKGDITNKLTWTAKEEANTSDHYQILIKVQEAYIATEQTPREHTWNFSSKQEKWDQYHELLTLSEAEYKAKCDDTKQKGLPTEQYVDEITANFTEHVFKAALCTFGRKIKQVKWHRYISRYGQRCSLNYIEYLRYLRQKRHITAYHWKKLSAIRKHRNKVVRDYTKRWYSRKFNEHRLEGKRGWTIANELRDINVHRGLRIPELLHHDKEVIVATTAKEKVQYLNTYYHRFQTDGTLPSNYCWPEDKIITPEEQPTLSPTTKPRHEAETINPIPKIHIPPTPWILNDQTDTTSFPEIQDYFSHLIVQYTEEKWRRCQDKHQYYLQHLNKDITELEVRRALHSFDNNKSEGSDLLHIRLLKHFPNVTAPLLTKLLNTVYSNEHVPGAVKERWITPIIKTGKPGNRAKELRPVSLTSYIGKIFEKIMNYRLTNYLIHLQLISPHHFAYLGGRSTTDCLITILDQLHRNINQRIPSHAIFFDFSSAFDTVQHNILLWKLEHEYFICGRFLRTIKSFLSNRRSSVRLDGYYSDWQYDTVGVPQGGALSPLLYLIYKDNLAVLNSMPNLHLCLYADDLSLFTSKIPVPRQQHLLQTGLLYIQWYSLHHGLRLNFTKTKQTYFKRTRIKDEYYPPLYFSKTVQNAFVSTRDDVTQMAANQRLKHDTNPFEYLGLTFDPTLRFQPHIEKTQKKCLKAYYTIHRHLRRLWSIPGDIAWRLFNTCVLSIMDYSSIIWGHLWNIHKDKLKTIHTRILRASLGTINGTPTIHLLHHLNTLDISRRQNLLNSKHFSRILRTPRSGILYQNIKDNWWNLIRFWCASHKKPSLTKEEYNNLHPRRLASLPKYNHVKKTILWTLTENAICYHNNDLQYITMTTKYEEIQSRISYTLDLTREWKQNTLHEEPYLDFDPILQTKKELYIFTDGSVKDQHGGYGYLITPSTDYHQWTKEMNNNENTDQQSSTEATLIPRPAVDLHEKLNEYFEHLQPLLSLPEYAAYSSPLSKRCSIDFCEASAIRDAITYIVDHLRISDIEGHTKCLLTSLPEHIRVISDSYTILQYIAGQYQIRHPVMKQIIDDIHWNASIIHEIQPLTSVSYQWTRSHEGTFGNEYADRLANEGRQLLYDVHHRDTRTGYWHFISEKAVNTANKKPFFSDSEVGIELELHRAISNSTYGKTYQHCCPRLPWSSRYFKESTQLRRDDVRLLIASRTGHDHLPYYLHECLNRPLSPFCECTDRPDNIRTAADLLQPQTRATLYKWTLHHLLSTCMDDQTRYFRRYIRHQYKTLHMQWYKALDSNDKLKHKYLWSRLDLTQSFNWTDPPLCYPTKMRIQIMKIHLHFFRRIIGYYHYRYTD